MRGRFQFVDDHRDAYGVKRLCKVLDLNRSSYYKWLAGRKARAARLREDQLLAERSREVHDESGGAYGSPRVTAEFREKGLRVNEKRIARVMRTFSITPASACAEVSAPPSGTRQPHSFRTCSSGTERAGRRRLRPRLRRRRRAGGTAALAGRRRRTARRPRHPARARRRQHPHPRRPERGPHRRLRTRRRPRPARPAGPRRHRRGCRAGAAAAESRLARHPARGAVHRLVPVRCLPARLRHPRARHAPLEGGVAAHRRRPSDRPGPLPDPPRIQRFPRAPRSYTLRPHHLDARDGEVGHGGREGLGLRPRHLEAQDGEVGHGRCEGPGILLRSPDPRVQRAALTQGLAHAVEAVARLNGTGPSSFHNRQLDLMRVQSDAGRGPAGTAGAVPRPLPGPARGATRTDAGTAVRPLA
ncbi:IS3 family transposase [Streptomyces sp. NPDC014889]|uniref:IS3 family transposase n=1 Tax=Streptomyces sp. NPDC014889 TaxID=3364928 RepID=UPI0036FADD37